MADRHERIASGPLTGLRIIEMGGLGPVPLTGMLLSDMGADVVRIDRAADVGRPNGPHRIPWDQDVTLRGRRSVALDLKQPEAVDTLLALVEAADGLIEGYRPGVMERLGVGPDTCHARNPRLVFGRITGWGQTGPLAPRPGHDINYAALAGALAHFGRAGTAPLPPLNLVADYAGGAMFLAYGMVAGLFEAVRSGAGQVVDSTMIDGVAVLMSFFHGAAHAGAFDTEHRGANNIDGASPWYDCFECSDGRYVSVGSVEPQFYAEFRRLLDLENDPLFDDPNDVASWPRARARVEEIFKSKSSTEWTALLGDEDVCFAPVLSIPESYKHPHNVDRGMFVEEYGVTQARPAPRFSRTEGRIAGPPHVPGSHTDEVLTEWTGVGADTVAELVAVGAARFAWQTR